jgi:hypothetical protein
MTRHISILGIDESENNTIIESLTAILAGELNTTVASVGDTFRIIANDQDICGPDFYPRSLPWQVRAALIAQKIAKRLENNKKWHPVFKYMHKFFQDAAAYRIAYKYTPDLCISDGNAVLSSFGQANDNSINVDSDEYEQRSIRECYSHAFYYLLVGGKLSSVVKKRFPKIDKIRSLSQKAQMFGCQGLWLPDLVIFLDSSPVDAMRRLIGGEKRIDSHENMADLMHARQRYLNSLKVFQDYRGGPGSVHIIHVDDLSIDQVLRTIINIIREFHVSLPVNNKAEMKSNDTLKEKHKSHAALRAKFSPGRYLFSYFLGKMKYGSWREPLFFFSRSGRQFLNHGYSASVIKTIYDHDSQKSGLMESFFHNYPLHYAVQERLQILTKQMQKIIRRKIFEYGEITIFTAPSGFSYEIFQPLENIAISSPHLMGRIKLVASDFDPAGAIEPELMNRAKRLGISCTFIKGDLTSTAVRKSIQTFGPFDIVLIVGLSNWIPKRPLLSHLRWVRRFMEWDSVLVTDCFTPAAYALSGSYIGYKAHYYSPVLFTKILDYCGYDGDRAVVESGNNSINHVMITCPQYSLEQAMLRPLSDTVTSL